MAWTFGSATKKDFLDSEEEAPLTLETAQKTATAMGDETQSLGTSGGSTAEMSMFDRSSGDSFDLDLNAGLDAMLGSGPVPNPDVADPYGTGVIGDVDVVFVDPVTGEQHNGGIDDFGALLDEMAAGQAEQNFPDAFGPSDPYGGDIGAMVEGWIGGQFGGPRDTSEDEALIRDLQMQAMGGSLADNAARMGRAGFSASGAGAAMSGDIRRQAAMDAAREMLDVRERARQEELSRASAALGGHFNMSRLASEDARREAMLQLLREMMDEGGAGGGDAGSGGGSGYVGEAIADVIESNPWLENELPLESDTLVEPNPEPTISSAQAAEMGLVFTGQTDASGYRIYADANGNTYKVPPSASDDPFGDGGAQGLA